MIGTSGALRVVHEGEPEPRPGLFCYLLDERRVVEGGAVSDGGNLLAWLERTLRLERPEPAAPDAHGLTFLPLLGGERSPGWNPRATGAIAGLTFDADAADLLQAALEGVAYRMAEIAERLPEVREVVATGHALLASRGWMQVFADVLGLPVTASGVDGRLGARRRRARARAARRSSPSPAPLGRALRAGPRAHRDLRGRPRAAARALPSASSSASRRRRRRASAPPSAMCSASIPAAASSSAGLPEPGISRTASRTTRAGVSPSESASSTASPIPPSGQWSSTVTIRPPVASAAARSVSASTGLTE